MSPRRTVRADPPAAPPVPRNPLIADLVKQVTKQFGEGAIGVLSDSYETVHHVLPTGIASVDEASAVGGWPLGGKISEIYGPECLAGDTYVRYSVRSVDGRQQNGKGGTIARLYHRFHKIPEGGKGRYQRPQTEGAVYYAPSVNDAGRIFQNRILDVVDAGQKPCYEVRLQGGASIVASADHRFLTESGYATLSALSVGDVVFTHTNTPYRGRHRFEWRSDVYVKVHPRASEKRVYDRKTKRTYAYRVLRRSRAVMEAHLNGLLLEEYLQRLNAGQIEGLRFLGKDEHVHHRDENGQNNDPSNLEIVSPAEHGRLHARERLDNLSFIIVPDRIVSIATVGPRQTYDLTMAAPANNFVANGFVVHNSVGKTTLSKLLAALSIKAGYLTGFIDQEGSLNLAPEFDAALGLDPSQLVVMGPPAIRTVEDCFQAIYRFVDLLKGKPGLILWDSVAATGTQVELETALDHAARPGVRALAMSRGFTQLMPRLKDSQVGIVFVNQMRERIGALPFQDKGYSPGGTAFHHFCHFRVEMKRIGNIQEGSGAGREIIGIRSRLRVKKSKIGPPHREGRIAIYFRGVVEEDPEE